TQVAATASVVAVVAIQVLGIIGLTQLANLNLSTLYIDSAALALGACILVPLTVAWRRVMPSWRPSQSAVIIDTIDAFKTVFFAEAVIGIALWINADKYGMAGVFAALGLVEFGLALALRWRAAQRVGLRYALEAIALILGSIGVVIVALEAPPNWALIAAL